MTIGVYFLLVALAMLPLIPSRVQSGFYYLLVIYMLLLAGFRYQVGTDYLAYADSFERLQFWYSEVGFIYFVELLRAFRFSSQGVFFVCAVLIQVLIFWFFKKYSVSKEVLFLSIFFYIALYYFQASMNVIRQFLAIGLFLLNVHHIIEKKWIRYHLVFFISLLFHSSALFFYPVYMIPKLFQLINTTQKRLFVLTVAFLFIFVKVDQWVIQLLLQLPSYEVYALYLSEQYLTYDLSWKMLVILVVKFFIYCWLILKKADYIHSKEQEVIFQLFFLAAILTFPLYPMLLFRRLLFYVTILEVLIFAYFAATNTRAKWVLVSFALVYYAAHLLSGFDTPLPYNINVKLFD